MLARLNEMKRKKDEQKKAKQAGAVSPLGRKSSLLRVQLPKELPPAPPPLGSPGLAMELASP